MSDPIERRRDPEASEVPGPVVAGVVPGPEEAPATYEAARAGPDPTVGTGSVFAVGCVILLLVAMGVLAAVFFLPFLRG